MVSPVQKQPQSWITWLYVTRIKTMITSVIERNAAFHYSFIPIWARLSISRVLMACQKNRDKGRVEGWAWQTQTNIVDSHRKYCVKPEWAHDFCHWERCLAREKATQLEGHRGHCQLRAPASSRPAREAPRHVVLGPTLNDIIGWLFLNFLWCTFHLLTLLLSSRSSTGSVKRILFGEPCLFR